MQDYYNLLIKITHIEIKFLQIKCQAIFIFAVIYEISDIFDCDLWDFL